MEFYKKEDTAYVRALHVYNKQQVRRYMATVRKNNYQCSCEEAMESTKRTPVYVFKASIAGKRGFVVMSEREVAMAGIPVEKAEMKWVTEPRKQSKKEMDNK